jgi:hypothetical protein
MTPSSSVKMIASSEHQTRPADHVATAKRYLWDALLLPQDGQDLRLELGQLLNDIRSNYSRWCLVENPVLLNCARRRAR